MLIFRGLFKKVVISSYMATIVDPVFSFPDAHNGWETLWGDLRLRHPDLCRLQRLHRHRHRRRAAARHSLPAELRRALPVAVGAGVLAALAHDAVALAA